LGAQDKKFGKQGTKMELGHYVALDHGLRGPGKSNDPVA
jgi:hypothetical protein